MLPELELADPAGSRRNPSLVNPYTPRLHRVPAPELSKQGDTLYPMRVNDDNPPLKLRIPQDGSRTERGVRSADGTSRQAIQPRLPAGSQTARHATDHSSRAAQRKRSERVHDSYVTAVSKETLLSEQYDKELIQLHEDMRRLLERGAGSTDRAVREEQALLRSRAKLEKHCNGMESRLNGLETYNVRLVAVINAIRKQNAPHRQAMKRAQAATEKLAIEMAQHKQLTYKALDERERFVEQLKHIRDECEQERDNFDEAVTDSGKKGIELDEENRKAMRTLEKATEEAKIQQYVTWRSQRAHKERLEVRYGYLRSQLEGIDREFRELERIVGVHFAPSQPESLQRIIDTFVEKEGRVVSLQKYWAMQNEEVERMQHEVWELNELAESMEAGSSAEAGASAGNGTGAALQSPRTALEHEQEAKKLDEFDTACLAIERMFRIANCEGSKALSTTGCSSSTVHEFLSGLDSRLDQLDIIAAAMRDHATSSPHQLRKPNEILTSFLDARQRRPMTPTTIDAIKRKLPSISDQGGQDEGDGEAQESSRRAMKREFSKGSIDRQKRDEEIALWVQRQEAVRTAQAARPSMREYYQLESSRAAASSKAV